MLKSLRVCVCVYMCVNFIYIYNFKITTNLPRMKIAVPKLDYCNYSNQLNIFCCFPKRNIDLDCQRFYIQ